MKQKQSLCCFCSCLLQGWQHKFQKLSRYFAHTITTTYSTHRLCATMTQSKMYCRSMAILLMNLVQTQSKGIRRLWFKTPTPVSLNASLICQKGIRSMMSGLSRMRLLPRQTRHRKERRGITGQLQKQKSHPQMKWPQKVGRINKIS